MSTTSRIIFGSAASWMRIFITIISQLVIVPIYLSHWNVEVYGIWIAIQALIGLISMIDFGHQTFLHFEFLRFGNDSREKLRKNLWSGAALAFLISSAQIVLIIIFLASGKLTFFLGTEKIQNNDLIFDAGMVLLLQGVTWLISSSVAGLLSKALETFGYFPRMASWGLVVTVVSLAATVIAIINGAGLLTTGIVSTCATLLCMIPQYLDMYRLLRKEKIGFVSPSLRLGFKNFLKSLALTGRLLLEYTRQQGVRLIVAPLSGISALAAFSTMRTMSNFTLQGLTTITHPLMPELSRFLHQRDQERTEAAFGTLWIVLIAVLAPGVVILQAFIEPLYFIWTRGKLPFNPSLFAILSLSVLVYAAAQPALAIINGNNLLKVQLISSALVSVIVIAGIIILLPLMGIVAAGLALLSAEVAAALIYKMYAKRWLSQNGLFWPNSAFIMAIRSVILSAVGMCLMILFPALKWLMVALTLVLLLWNFWRYCQTLPIIVGQNVRRIMVKVPVINRLFNT